MKNFVSGSQKIGELGESIACKYLNKHGYSVLERNYTRKWGEIDIIAEKKKTKYFIEVKSKSVSDINLAFESETNRPEENMHIWKMKRLRKVVETYLISSREGNVEWRFDLFIVYMDIDKKLAKVKVVENIVL